MRRLVALRQVSALLTAMIAAASLTVALAAAAPTSQSVPGFSPLPDLSVKINTSNSGYNTPGAWIQLQMEITNSGFTATFPNTNMLLPQAFTNVKVAQNGSDVCTVRPPTERIPSHFIVCEALTGLGGPDGAYLGLLAMDQVRYINVEAHTPTAPGQYNIKAGIMTTEQQELDRSNNNTVRPVLVSPKATRVDNNADLNGGRPACKNLGIC